MVTTGPPYSTQDIDAKTEDVVSIGDLIQDLQRRISEARTRPPTSQQAATPPSTPASD